MDASWLSLIEMLFVYGIVLGLAVWQLIDVNRASARSKAKREAEEAAARTGADVAELNKQS